MLSHVAHSILIFFGTAALLWAALHTVALFFSWPALSFIECGVLLALSWLAQSAYYLALGDE